MSIDSPGVAAVVGAVAGLLLVAVGATAEPGLVVTSCAAGGALLAVGLRRTAPSSDDRLVANVFVLLNAVSLAWVLFGWRAGLVICAVIIATVGCGGGLDYLARRRRG
jgi:hypothetical protein